MKLPNKINFSLKKMQDLRYGENPHQMGGFYLDGKSAEFEQLLGIDLSYNNLEDAYLSWRLVSDFDEPTIAIIKHGNPSGISSRNDLVSGFKLAYACDSVSAYGGIVAINREPTMELIESMKGMFFELMVAPKYSKNIVERLKIRSKKMRIIKAKKVKTSIEIKHIFGGYIVQSSDDNKSAKSKWKVVAGRKLNSSVIRDCQFAWTIVKHVKSNAIVIAKDLNLLGVGIGQPNRVNSVNLATRQAGKRTKGAILASDAFFPFEDNVKLAHKYGISVIIQPGGSIRDAEVIKSAKKLGITMIFTSVRHFKH